MGTLKIDNGQPVLLKKIPFMMFPARSMAVFIQKISEDFDDDFIFDLGYEAGKQSGEEFMNDLGWIGKSFAIRKNSMFKMLEVMGFGKFEFSYWNAKQNKILLRVENLPVIEHAAKLYGQNEKSSLLYKAVYSAHANVEFGMTDCKLVETQSISKGDDFFEWSFNYFEGKEK